MATKKVFVGNGPKDQYLRNGKWYGPGTVEIAEEDYDDFVACVNRAQEDRDPKDRIDVRAVGTPAPVPITDATEEELLAMLTVKRRQNGQADPESDTGLTSDEKQAIADRQVEDANRAAQLAHDRAQELEKQMADMQEKLRLAQTPPPAPKPDKPAPPATGLAASLGSAPPDTAATTETK